MTSERNGPGVPGDSDPPPPDELARARDDFLKSFFRKGAKLAEELVRERESFKNELSKLEEENARLRAQVASDDAIRDLLRKIEQLETEKEDILRARREAETQRAEAANNHAEIESELANLANLYVASYQLHSSLSPRGVVRHVKELLAQLVGAEEFAVYLADDEGRRLVPIASEGVAGGDLLPVPIGEGPVGETFTRGTTQVAEADPRAGSLAKPAATVPIRIEDKVVGVIAVYRTLEQKEAFIPVDHELLKLLGTQAMTALVAARFYTDHGRSLPSLSAFRDLGV